MAAAQKRKLTAYEREQLARASAVLRRSRRAAMNPRIKHVKFTTLPDGRKFPIYKGEVLSRSPSSAFTWKDESEGSPRVKLILSTMTRAELLREYNDALRGSFDRVFVAGKRYFKLVEGEARRRGILKMKTGMRGNPAKSTRGSASKTVVRIYGRVLRVEAQKTGAHQCDAECRRCNHKYFHDFRVPTGVKMLGLSPGQVFKVPAGCWPILLFAQKGK